MRKRIEQLARGKFEYAKPNLSFSEKTVEFSVYEGADYTGEFTIRCTNQVPIRGVVYSTNPRMKCLTTQFESRTIEQTTSIYEQTTITNVEYISSGEEIKIRYQFHSKGLEEGRIEKGRFIIICNQCEINLSFCASVLRQYPQSSYGEIRNISDFTILAKESKEEAFRMFYHKNFLNIFGKDHVKEQMLYRGLLASKSSVQNMEEFLIGVGEKERISISVVKQKYEFYAVKEIVKDILEIQKDNWGFVEISVSADAEFIRFEKDVITSDMFLGNVYPLEFFIDETYMHGGNNYAKITLSSPYESCVVEVFASVKEKHSLPTVEETYHTKKKKSLARIAELYLEYRLKRVVTGVWTKETTDILDALYVMEPQELLYPLMKAQCLLLNKQRQDAEWILDEFKRKCTNRKSPTWGYYLYVKSLMEKEPVLVDRITNEIEDIFKENKDSRVLCWVLLHLKEEFDDVTYKLKYIRNYIKKGCASPYFYIEAYYLLVQNPKLLVRLGSFEMRILQWAIRHKAITKEIATQIFAMMEHKKEYSSTVYKMLCEAYCINPQKEYVGIICGYLIKAHKYDHKYHSWYERGIELELRITGLYEAYLISMDERSIIAIPKVIHKYFQYACAVPYRKLAVLYNNIVASKETDMETYEEYFDTISRFAKEHIAEGHMDDNLSVIYEDMLEVGKIGEDMAKSLAKILFLRKLVVFDKRIKRAIVYQSQLKEPQVISIVNQSAYFQLISKDYVIVFEDETGLRYAGGISYQLQNLMDAQKYMPICMNFAPQELAYVLAHIEKKWNEKQSLLECFEEEERCVQQILDSEKVSMGYKIKLLPDVLRFYYKKGNKTKLLEYLKITDYGKLLPDDRKFAIGLFIEYGLYEQAYEKLVEYGTDQLDTEQKATLVSYMIAHYQEEKEFLVLLTAEVFRLGKSDRKIIEYLTNYYNASTKELLSLWEAGNCFPIERQALSERLLTQIVYTESELRNSIPVFSFYHKGNGKEALVLAYLSLCAHDYFLYHKETDAMIFSIMQERIQKGEVLNDICKLALLFYYSRCKQLTQQQTKIVDVLLAEYTKRQMYFAFYKNLHIDLQQKYHFYDKMFLEYRTNPSNHVTILYKKDLDSATFLKEEMRNVYEGIFVKDFVMFFGEVVEYEIHEQQEKAVKVLERSRLMSHSTYEKDELSRYSLLNQMLVSNILQEDADVYQSMKRYAEYEHITKSVFKLL